MSTSDLGEGNNLAAGSSRHFGSRQALTPDGAEITTLEDGVRSEGSTEYTLGVVPDFEADGSGSPVDGWNSTLTPGQMVEAQQQMGLTNNSGLLSAATAATDGSGTYLSVSHASNDRSIGSVSNASNVSDFARVLAENARAHSPPPAVEIVVGGDGNHGTTTATTATAAASATDERRQIELRKIAAGSRDEGPRRNPGAYNWDEDEVPGESSPLFGRRQETTEAIGGDNTRGSTVGFTASTDIVPGRWSPPSRGSPTSARPIHSRSNSASGFPTPGRRSSTASFSGMTNSLNQILSDVKEMDRSKWGAKIPKAERFTISPFEKLRKYGRFPFKFSIHVIVLALLVVNIYLYQQRESNADDQQRYAIVRYFMPSGYQSPKVDYISRPTYYFSSVHEIRKFVDTIVGKYNHLGEDSPAEFNAFADKYVNTIGDGKHHKDYHSSLKRNKQPFRSRGGTRRNSWDDDDITSEGRRRHAHRNGLGQVLTEEIGHESGRTSRSFYVQHLTEEGTVESVDPTTNKTEKVTITRVKPPLMRVAVSSRSPRFNLGLRAANELRWHSFNLAHKREDGIFGKFVKANYTEAAAEEQQRMLQSAATIGSTGAHSHNRAQEAEAIFETFFPEGGLDGETRHSGVDIHSSFSASGSPVELNPTSNSNDFSGSTSSDSSSSGSNGSNVLPKSLYDIACAVRPDASPDYPGISGDDGAYAQPPYYYKPCRPTKHRTIFDSLDSVEIEFNYLIHAYDYSADNKITFEWHVNFYMDFREEALVPLTVSVKSADWVEFDPATAPILISFAITILLLIDFVLRTRSFVKVYTHRRKAKAKAKAQQTSMREGFTSSSDSSDEEHHQQEAHAEREKERLVEAEKEKEEAHRPLRRLNTVQIRQTINDKIDHRHWKKRLRLSMGFGWALFGVVADLILLIYVALDWAVRLPKYIPPSNDTVQVRNMFLGLGFLMYSTLLQNYLRYFPKQYFLIRAMSLAMPHLGYFLVGILPIFYGFSIFALTVFGAYTPQYSTMLESMTALYSSLFGDSLLQSFQDSGSSTTWIIVQISRVFCFSFVSLFMWCILNIAMAIVVDSYAHVRGRFGLFDPGTSRKRVDLRGSNILLHIRSNERMKCCALQEINRRLAVLDMLDSSDSEDEPDLPRLVANGILPTSPISEGRERVLPPRRPRASTMTTLPRTPVSQNTTGMSGSTDQTFPITSGRSVDLPRGSVLDSPNSSPSGSANNRVPRSEYSLPVFMATAKPRQQSPEQRAEAAPEQQKEQTTGRRRRNTTTAIPTTSNSLNNDSIARKEGDGGDSEGSELMDPASLMDGDPSLP